MSCSPNSEVIDTLFTGKSLVANVFYPQQNQNLYINTTSITTRFLLAIVAIQKCSFDIYHMQNLCFLDVDALMN